MPSRFSGIENLRLILQGADDLDSKRQGAAPGAGCVQLGDHITVAQQMLQGFEANDFDRMSEFRGSDRKD